MSQIIEIKNYRTLDATSREKALEQVDFAVDRAVMTFERQGAQLVDGKPQTFKTEREAIYKMDDEGNPVILGYASPDYKLIKHREALDAMF